jgi:hypothetical protein
MFLGCLDSGADRHNKRVVLVPHVGWQLVVWLDRLVCGVARCHPCRPSVVHIAAFHSFPLGQTESGVDQKEVVSVLRYKFRRYAVVDAAARRSI